MEINLSKVIPFILVIFAILMAISTFMRNMPNTEHDAQIANKRDNAIINLSTTNHNESQFNDAAIIQRFPTMESVYKDLQGKYTKIAKNDTIKSAIEIYRIDENITKLLDNKTTIAKINGNSDDPSILSIRNKINGLKTLQIYNNFSNNFENISTEFKNAINNYNNTSEFSKSKNKIDKEFKTIENITNNWKYLILRYQKYSAQMAMESFNQNGDLTKAQNYLNNSTNAEKEFKSVAKPHLFEIDIAKYVINNEKYNTDKNYLEGNPSCSLNPECTVGEINSIGSNLSKLVENGLLFHMDKPTGKIFSITNPLISFVNSLTLVFIIFLLVAPIVTWVAIKEFLF